MATPSMSTSPVPGTKSDPSGAMALQFTEEMKGYVALGAADFQAGAESQDAYRLMFRLTIATPDVAAFLSDPTHPARADGYIQCDGLGGKLFVERGWFNLFVDASAGQRRMLYCLHFQDGSGRQLTLLGFKSVRAGAAGMELARVWSDTSTLYTKLLEGHLEAEGDASARVLAMGILHIEKTDFIRQLTTLRVIGSTLPARARAAAEFGKFFLGNLWDVYGVHTFPPLRLERTFRREIPLYTLEGVRDCEIGTHPFTTPDGLGLSMLRFLRKPADDIVLIIHGLTTSSDMFIMPEHYNLVSYLLDHSFTDVWTLDFRMSNRHPYNLLPNRYNMDDIALFDFPAAIAEMRRHVGDRAIHVICHCLGAVSFSMSLFGGATTGIASLIANSISLTPRVPGWSKVKLAFAPFLIEYAFGFPYINPRWAEDPGLTRGKMFSKLVSFFHRECDVPACHMLSLMWGAGWPALYSHENLHDVTHRRGGDLYGGVAMHYYRHVRRMVRANNTAVKFDPRDPRYSTLPDNYFDHVKEITTPVLFMTGRNNRVFADSNVVCHQRMEQLVPGRHELHIFEGYGHQDVFMGKNNHLDVFPRLLQFLEKHRGRRA